MNKTTKQLTPLESCKVIADFIAASDEQSALLHSILITARAAITRQSLRETRLADAAPDLLVACRSALAWLEYCNMDDTAQAIRLRAAIAKATGPCQGDADASEN